MSIAELRQHIHQLVDTAPEGYLVEVLDLLEPQSSTQYKYSDEDIARFNQIAKDIEDNPSLGMSVEE